MSDQPLSPNTLPMQDWTPWGLRNGAVWNFWYGHYEPIEDEL